MTDQCKLWQTWIKRLHETNLDHLEPTRTILDQLGPFWTNLDQIFNKKRWQTNKNYGRQVLGDQIRQLLTLLDQIEPDWTILDHLEPIWT